MTKTILILYISPSKLPLATGKKFEKNVFNTSYWITIFFLLIGLCSCCDKFFGDIFRKSNKDKSTGPFHEEILSTWNWRKFFTHSKPNQSLFSMLLKHSYCKYLIWLILYTVDWLWIRLLNLSISLHLCRTGARMQAPSMMLSYSYLL